MNYSPKAVAFGVSQSRWRQRGSPLVPDRSLAVTSACFESCHIPVSCWPQVIFAARGSGFFFCFDDLTPGRFLHLGPLKPLCYLYRLLPVLWRSHLAGSTRPTPSISASSAACRSKVLRSAAPPPRRTKGRPERATRVDDSPRLHGARPRS